MLFHRSAHTKKIYWLIFKLKLFFTFLTKQATLMRRPIVQSLPSQLVFPGFFCQIKNNSEFKKIKRRGLWGCILRKGCQGFWNLLLKKNSPKIGSKFWQLVLTTGAEVLEVFAFCTNLIINQGLSPSLEWRPYIREPYLTFWCLFKLPLGRPWHGRECVSNGR